MNQEFKNLEILVDLVAQKVVTEIEAGSDKKLKELLWNVPTNILADYAREKEEH